MSNYPNLDNREEEPLGNNAWILAIEKSCKEKEKEIISLRKMVEKYKSISKRFLSAIVDGNETDYNRGKFAGEK